jgi:HSP20 family protein
MRWRYLSLSYQFGGAATSLERHFRELREAMLHPSQQHYTFLQPAAPWRPPMDIHETPDAIAVKIELAGVRDEDIEISLYDNALVVGGRREDDYDHDETICYHEAQVRYGPFRADVLLHVPIRQEAAEATYQNGFLRILLPKAEPAEQGTRESERPDEQDSAGDGSNPANALPFESQEAQSLTLRRAGRTLEILP